MGRDAESCLGMARDREISKQTEKKRGSERAREGAGEGGRECACMCVLQIWARMPQVLLIAVSGVQELLLALGPNAHGRPSSVRARCPGLPVTIGFFLSLCADGAPGEPRGPEGRSRRQGRVRRFAEPDSAMVEARRARNWAWSASCHTTAPKP
jgi:hypothetical protein